MARYAQFLEVEFSLPPTEGLALPTRALVVDRRPIAIVDCAKDLECLLELRYPELDLEGFELSLVDGWTGLHEHICNNDKTRALTLVDRS